MKKILVRFLFFLGAITGLFALVERVSIRHPEEQKGIVLEGGIFISTWVDEKGDAFLGGGVCLGEFTCLTAKHVQTSPADTGVSGEEIIERGAMIFQDQNYMILRSTSVEHEVLDLKMIFMRQSMGTEFPEIAEGVSMGESLYASTQRGYKRVMLNVGEVIEFPETLRSESFPPESILTVDRLMIHGDSGAGVYNASGELVGIVIRQGEGVFSPRNTIVVNLTHPEVRGWIEANRDYYLLGN